VWLRPAFVELTGIALYFGIDVRTVSDMGELPDSLPMFLWPEVPLTFETLQIIFPYSLALALVGLPESLMTATIVDDLTDTNSNKNRECVGQGIVNIGSGLIGGMAGCAMIGQSMINVKSVCLPCSLVYFYYALPCSWATGSAIYRWLRWLP
jgi:SulP family sulfate permease